MIREMRESDERRIRRNSKQVDGFWLHPTKSDEQNWHSLDADGFIAYTYNKNMADDAKQLDEKWVVVPLKKKTYSKDYTFWVRYSKNDMDEKRFTSLILQKNKEFKKILQKINMSLFDNRRRLIHRESYSPVDEERDLKLVGIEESKLNKKRDQKLREIRILGEIAPMPAVKQLVTTVEQKYNEYNEYKRERRILLGL